MQKKVKNSNLTVSLSLGVCFGLADWVIFDNMEIGISTAIVLSCMTYIVTKFTS